jgi:hypothetical protein
MAVINLSLQGPQGSVGTPGSSGNTGPQGPRGFQGSQGHQGDPGDGSALPNPEYGTTGVLVKNDLDSIVYGEEGEIVSLWDGTEWTSVDRTDMNILTNNGLNARSSQSGLDVNSDPIVVGKYDIYAEYYSEMEYYILARKWDSDTVQGLNNNKYWYGARVFDLTETGKGRRLLGTITTTNSLPSEVVDFQYGHDYVTGDWVKFTDSTEHAYRCNQDHVSKVNNAPAWSSGDWSVGDRVDYAGVTYTLEVWECLLDHSSNLTVTTAYDGGTSYNVDDLVRMYGTAEEETSHYHVYKCVQATSGGHPPSGLRTTNSYWEYQYTQGVAFGTESNFWTMKGAAYTPTDDAGAGSVPWDDRGATSSTVWVDVVNYRNRYWGGACYVMYAVSRPSPPMS